MRRGVALSCDPAVIHQHKDPQLNLSPCHLLAVSLKCPFGSSANPPSWKAGCGYPSRLIQRSCNTPKMLKGHLFDWLDRDCCQMLDCYFKIWILLCWHESTTLHFFVFLGIVYFWVIECQTVSSCLFSKHTTYFNILACYVVQWVIAAYFIEVLSPLKIIW